MAETLSGLAKELGVEEERLASALRDLAKEGLLTARLLERFISSEVGRVEGEIVHLREVMDERVGRVEGEIVHLREVMDERVGRVESEVRHLREVVEGEIVHLREVVDERVGRVEGEFRHLRELMEERTEHLGGTMKRGFEELDARMGRVERWFLYAFIPIALALLGILVKLFLGP